jgi:superfamily II DNA or RNA helicase
VATVCHQTTVQPTPEPANVPPRRLDALRTRFRPETRRLGQQYQRDGEVELLDVTEGRAVAIVYGTQPYRVVIGDFEKPKSCLWECTCKHFEAVRSCKHVWATMIELDALLTELAETEHLFSADGPQGLPRGQQVDQQDNQQDNQQRIDRKRDAVAEAAPGSERPSAQPLALVPSPAVPQPLPAWRRRLLRVLPEPSEGVELPHLYYFVYLRIARPTVRDRGLVLEVRQRTAKKNGQLGVLRQGEIKPAVLEQLAAPDRALLQLMREDQALQWAPWLRSFAEHSVSLQQPWFVPTGLVTKVLQLLPATGHVYVGTDDESTLQPLTIDVAEPFRALLFKVVDGGTARFDAIFERGGLAIPKSAANLDTDLTYLITDGKLVCMEVGGAGELMHELEVSGPLQMPVEEVPQALAALARIGGASMFLRDLLEELPAGKPTGVVDLELPKEREVALPARLRFLYDGGGVVHGDPAPVVEAAGAVVRRDFDAEARLAEAAKSAGLQAMPTPTGFGCERAHLPEMVRALTAQGFRVFAAGRLVRPFQASHGLVKKEGGWLEVDAAVEFAGRRVGLPELLRVVGAPHGFYELGDGSYGMLPEAWAERLEALRQLGGDVTAAGAIAVPEQRMLWLDALLDKHAADFDVDPHVAKLRQRLREVGDLQPLAEPKGFQGQLRPYQQSGLAWLAFLEEFGLGGCLADEMGLGKTVQVLAHLVKHHGGRKKRPPSLLVAPRSVLPNWLAECAKFAPGLRVVDFSTPDRWQAHTAAIERCDLMLTTYAMLRTDVPRMLERGWRFSYAVLDEAQAAKNADSQTSKAVRLLPSERRLAMTGTPVENHLGELWTLFEFLNPGMLGKLGRFRELFRGDLADESRTSTRELIQRSLRPVMLRRTKAQVLTDLPPRLETTLWCDLDDGARRRYDQLRKYYREQLLVGDGDLRDKRIVVLQALLRLRQAACHEALLDPERSGEPGAKFEVLLPRLEELAEEGRKALVFSQFTSLLDLLEPELARRGIAFERLDGKTKERKARVDRFQNDPKVPVFLISLKAGGVGLNLTAAEYVFLLDPWWNPAAELQAIDRAHRIGQQHTVHAYRVVCRNTVEERVLELQDTKRKLCEAVLGNDRSLLQDLSREDLELLLG